MAMKVVTERMGEERLEELEENAEWNTTPGTGDPRLGLGVQLADACREIRRAWKETEGHSAPGSCGNCAYRIEESDRLLCGRYPPAVVAETYSRALDYLGAQVVNTDIVYVYPSMGPDERCGEYKAGVGIKVKEAGS